MRPCRRTGGRSVAAQDGGYDRIVLVPGSREASCKAELGAAEGCEPAACRCGDFVDVARMSTAVEPRVEARVVSFVLVLRPQMDEALRRLMLLLEDASLRGCHALRR